MPGRELLADGVKKSRWAELMSCVKVEVDVLGSPSLTVLVFSVDGKQHLRRMLKPQSSGAV